MQSQKIIKCPVKTCPKEFKSSFMVQRHMLTHTKLRQYQCHLCPKTFAYNQYYQEHLNHHNNRKPFKCRIDACRERFEKSAQLYHHKKNVHKSYIPRKYVKVEGGSKKRKTWDPPSTHFQAKCLRFISEGPGNRSSQSTDAESSEHTVNSGLNGLRLPQPKCTDHDVITHFLADLQLLTTTFSNARYQKAQAFNLFQADHPEHPKPTNPLALIPPQHFQTFSPQKTINLS
jgi:hypothetical protein